MVVELTRSGRVSRKGLNRRQRLGEIRRLKADNIAEAGECDRVLGVLARVRKKRAKMAALGCLDSGLL